MAKLGTSDCTLDNAALILLTGYRCRLAIGDISSLGPAQRAASEGLWPVRSCAIESHVGVLRGSIQEMQDYQYVLASEESTQNHIYQLPPVALAAGPRYIKTTRLSREGQRLRMGAQWVPQQSLDK